jgi:hypothetical protein
MSAPLTTPRLTPAELLEKYREKELASISRSLHDDIAPALCGIGLQLSVLRSELAGSSPEAAGMAGELLNALEHTVDAVRSLNYMSDPGLAWRCGLGSAIDSLLRHPPAGYTGQTSFDRASGDPPRCAESAAAFRIIRELWRSSIAAAPGDPFHVALERKPDWQLRIEPASHPPDPHQSDLFRLWARDAGLSLQMEPGLLLLSWAGE